MWRRATGTDGLCATDVPLLDRATSAAPAGMLRGGLPRSRQARDNAAALRSPSPKEAAETRHAGRTPSRTAAAPQGRGKTRRDEARRGKTRRDEARREPHRSRPCEMDASEEAEPSHPPRHTCSKRFPTARGHATLEFRRPYHVGLLLLPQVAATFTPSYLRLHHTCVRNVPSSPRPVRLGLQGEREDETLASKGRPR